MDFLSPPKMSSFPNAKKLLRVGNDEEEQHHHHHRAREEEKRRRQRTGDDTTTTVTKNDDAEKSVMKMIKKALVLISEKMCDDTKGGESDAVARLGAYLSEGKNSNVAMKGGSKFNFCSRRCNLRAKDDGFRRRRICCD
jgi:homospermidine synthase